MFTRRSPSRGFTLIESIIFMVVISIGLVAILNVMNVANRSSADPLIRKQAQMIAEGLLEEVMLAKITFCDPGTGNYDEATATAQCVANGAIVEGWGGEAGNTRPYDNVNDYVTGSGVAQSSFNSSGNLVDANGTVIGGGSYSATVMITPVQLNDIAITAGAADSNSFEIVVTVTAGNTSVVLTGYRTRYAPRDR